MVADTPTAAACSKVRLAGFCDEVGPRARVANSANAPAHQPNTSSPGRRLRHVLADRFDGPRDVRPRDGVLRRAQPGGHAHDERRAGHEDPVAEVDGCRVDADQHLVCADSGMSMSRACRTSAEPYLSWTIAFIWCLASPLRRGAYGVRVVCMAYATAYDVHMSRPAESATCPCGGLLDCARRLTLLPFAEGHAAGVPMRKTMLLALAMSAVALLAACSSGGASGLTGKGWQLTAENGTAVGPHPHHECRIHAVDHPTVRCRASRHVHDRDNPTRRRPAIHGRT